MTAERAHLVRLMVWAVASVLAGTALLAWIRVARRHTTLLEHFGVQSLRWGVVELGYAAWSLHALAPRDVSAATRMDRILWLNLGLDIGFIMTGLALVIAAWKLGRRLGLVGAGVGVVVQGVALSLLNLLLASVISR